MADQSVRDLSDAQLDKRMDQEFGKGGSHRELATGRNFLWNVMRFHDNDTTYAKNFDRIFPDAPGAGI